MTEPIFPCLWFESQAQDAAEYYCSIFHNSRIQSSGPVVVIFELNSRKFMGLNGGPHYKLNEAVSFVITCKDQIEIDHYWDKLSEGGTESQADSGFIVA